MAPVLPPPAAATQIVQPGIPPAHLTASCAFLRTMVSHNALNSSDCMTLQRGRGSVYLADNEECIAKLP